MTLDFMKDQRKKKVNLCTIQKMEQLRNEVDFNSFGITDEQLVLNCALGLSKYIKEVPLLKWCPAVEQLLEEGSVTQVLLKLLSAMKHEHKELSE